MAAVTVLSLEDNISQPGTPFWDTQAHTLRSGSTKLYDSHCSGTRSDLFQQHLYVRIKFPPQSWSSLWWNLSLFAHFFFNFMPFFPNPIRSLSIFCVVVQASSFWNYPVFQIGFFFFCERFLTPLCLTNKIPSQSSILLEDRVSAVLRAVAVHLCTFAFSIIQSLEIKAGSYSFLALAQRMFLATLTMSDFLKFANLISVT